MDFIQEGRGLEKYRLTAAAVKQLLYPAPSWLAVKCILVGYLKVLLLNAPFY
jgi:hypothetical protein